MKCFAAVVILFFLHPFYLHVSVFLSVPARFWRRRGTDRLRKCTEITDGFKQYHGVGNNCVVMAELFCGQAGGERLGGGGGTLKKERFIHMKSLHSDIQRESFFKFNVAFVCLRACSLVTLTWDS